MLKLGLNFKKIKLSKKNGTLTITISNPPVNALSWAVRKEIEDALTIADKTSDIKDILLTSEGNYFSAGADLKNEVFPIVRQCNLPADEETGFGPAYDFAIQGQALTRGIQLFPKPITAFINGYALGGGLELALACHEIYVTERSYIGLPEVTLGLIPGWGGTVRFSKLTEDKNFAMGLIMSGAILNMEEACDFGIIHRDNIYESIPENKLNPPPRRIISPHAKQLLLNLFNLTEWTFEDEARAFNAACSHPDALEGVSAFLEKRKPNFEK
ncbi:MAG: enoyl-CoA hydratase/isomerase family protein [Candidatus Niyogibacteria bacterium]|nr:enoyl-CoA hydratase/isomerase family protein [Candidatus Niyogibacteria bacterium]